MNDLFDKKAVEHYIGRINTLSHTSKAQWGKMDVAQMLTHCQKTFLVADGTIKLKPNAIIKLLFGKKGRRDLLANVPFKKNLPTFPEAKIVSKQDFEKEKVHLIEKIENYNSKGPSGVKLKDHPFFGDMTPDTWNNLLTLHLNHHLTQFGA